MKSLVKVVLCIVTVAYPFLIFFGLSVWGMKMFYFLFAILAVLYLLSAKNGDNLAWLWLLVIVVLGLWMALSHSVMPAKMYPVAISSGLALVFLYSLQKPPSMIEKFARLREPRLSEAGIRYTRKVTQVWLAFFVVNAMISAYTAIYMSEASWVIYNGFLSYVFIALLFSVEWLVRQKVKDK